jgi:hypothetical protein
MMLKLDFPPRRMHTALNNNITQFRLLTVPTLVDNDFRTINSCSPCVLINTKEIGKIGKAAIF